MKPRRNAALWKLVREWRKRGQVLAMEYTMRICSTQLARVLREMEKEAKR